MDSTDYPYIVAWGRMLGSYDYYIERQVERARETGAPANATYEESTIGGDPTGEWHTFDDITADETRRRLRRYLRDMGVEQ